MPRVRSYETLRKTRQAIDRAIAAAAVAYLGVAGAIIFLNLPR